MKLANLGMKSLQARLLLGAMVWIVVGLLFSGIAITAVFRQYVVSQFAHELADHLTELQSLATLGPDNRLTILRPVSDPRFAVPGSGYYWEVRRAGQVILRSDSLAGRDLATVPIAGLQVIHAPLRMASNAPLLDFAVAGDSSELDLVMRRFERLLAISLGIIAIGLSGAATAQVAFGLRPLRRLRQSLKDVQSGQIEALPDDFPMEVRPLVRDLNGLIRAQTDMVKRARAQAGNLGHALRTPLTIQMAQARSLAAGGQSEAADVILAQCQAMSRQVDYQMARARAAASRAGPGAHVWPAIEADKIISAMEKLWSDRGVRFRNGIPPDLCVAVNADDLGEILSNLIDNAAKFAAKSVCLSGCKSGDVVELNVEDDGPGIPEAHLQSVFEIGERLDERKPGSGLGLAIVKDIVGLYGGHITLGSSALGGLRATLALPTAE